jgi:hypothetical protein
MITNDNHHFDYKIRLDENTVLNIARERQYGKLACQAEFCQKEAELCNFYTANEIFEHYYVTKCELQDSILRIIDFIDGKL